MLAEKIDRETIEEPFEFGFVKNGRIRRAHGGPTELARPPFSAASDIPANLVAQESFLGVSMPAPMARDEWFPPGNNASEGGGSSAHPRLQP